MNDFLRRHEKYFHSGCNLYTVSDVRYRTDTDRKNLTILRCSQGCNPWLALDDPDHRCCVYFESMRGLEGKDSRLRYRDSSYLEDRPRELGVGAPEVSSYRQSFQLISYYLPNKIHLG